MLMTVFELRDADGQRLAPDAILARPRVRGNLVYGSRPQAGPVVNAWLYGPDGGTELLPYLQHANIVKVAAGKILIRGRYIHPATHEQHPQSWLCALDEADGEVAVRAMRVREPWEPPEPQEAPLNPAYYPGGVAPPESEAPFD